jgi:hypothetical protein
MVEYTDAEGPEFQEYADVDPINIDNLNPRSLLTVYLLRIFNPDSILQRAWNFDDEIHDREERYNSKKIKSGREDVKIQILNSIEEIKMRKKYHHELVEGVKRKFIEEGLLDENADEEDTVVLFYSAVSESLRSAEQELLSGVLIEDSHSLARLRLLMSWGDQESVEHLVPELESIREGNYRNIKPSGGDGSTDFMLNQYELVDVNTLKLDQLIFIPGAGCYGVVRIVDGNPQIDVIFDTIRPKYTTGLPMSHPKLTLENVAGGCIPIDWYQGLDGGEEMYKGIWNVLKQSGIQTIETHMFDPMYLPGAIDNGKFSVPHMEGVLVETREMDTSDEINLKYVNQRMPYFFFILDGDQLLRRLPLEENHFNGYHHIKGGINFNDKAIISIVVSDNMRERLLSWIESWNEDDRLRIFGDNDPSKIFISNVFQLEESVKARGN